MITFLPNFIFIAGHEDATFEVAAPPSTLPALTLLALADAAKDTAFSSHVAPVPPPASPGA